MCLEAYRTSYLCLNESLVYSKWGVEYNSAWPVVHPTSHSLIVRVVPRHGPGVANQILKLWGRGQSGLDTLR